MARILLIDDHDPAIIDLAVHLEANEHEVLFAAGGRRALGDVAALRYDALVTGLIQPDVSGWFIIRRARRTNPRAAIFATYGLKHPLPHADLMRFTEAQGAMPVMKPIEPRVLAMRISLELGRAHLAANASHWPSSA
jgi:DNA-binding response OmpR family regulator